MTNNKNMKFRVQLIFAVTAMLLGLCESACWANQQPGSEPGIPEGIVWHGTLTDGLKEAKETGKPIFLISAAPNCAGVSGIW